MNSTTVTGGAGEALRVVSGLATDRGLHRELNEDSLLATQTVFAVADGMGGHESGEVASGVAVRTLAESDLLNRGARPVQAEDIQALLLVADSQIREMTNSLAGTTMTGLILTTKDDVATWLVFNIGDSRVYCLFDGQLVQVSRDHSAVQLLVDIGEITPEEALTHPRRNIVTRALGSGSELAADFWSSPVGAGQRWLICSDGLTNELSDHGITAILGENEDPQAAADALIVAAVRAGGRDNITAIVVDVLPAANREADEDVDEDGAGAGVADAGVADAGASSEPAGSTRVS